VNIPRRLSSSGSGGALALAGAYCASTMVTCPTVELSVSTEVIDDADADADAVDREGEPRFEAGGVLFAAVVLAEAFSSI